MEVMGGESKIAKKKRKQMETKKEKKLKLKKTVEHRRSTEQSSNP